ncbi:hypothetical protein TNCV_4611551 [Trichonephila clavipes]|nr:hypothetical protein TNCV_4611551 [Trichonephila clavipes]
MKTMVICFKSKASLNTMQRQSDGNYENRLLHHSRRFHRCCGVKGRLLKGVCERNPALASHREVMDGTTGGYKRGCSMLNCRQWYRWSSSGLSNNHPILPRIWDLGLPEPSFHR